MSIVMPTVNMLNILLTIILTLVIQIGFTLILVILSLMLGNNNEKILNFQINLLLVINVIHKGLNKISRLYFKNILTILSDDCK
jgi:hypothetical protein